MVIYIYVGFGGYCGYLLYNLIMSGFWLVIFVVIVDGIVELVEYVYVDVVFVEVLFLYGELYGVSIN